MPYARLKFKLASAPEEFEQVHRLNYRTFVEEIPQHPPNEQKVLVDRFHDENIYPICLDGRRVVGMMALRSQRPFSLDDKVTNLDSYLPQGTEVCEFRLLAVEPDYRKPGVFASLVRFAASEGVKRGYNLAVASGTVRQTRLYTRMGFVPFADPVGSTDARFQPMYLTLSTAQQLFARLGDPLSHSPSWVSFMPGPVEISAAVQDAVGQLAVSHRGEPFLAMVADVKERLLALTGAASVELLLGSGTLGNDVVAAQLKLLSGRGLILTNGEFGDRLVDHASRMGLAFDLLRFDWGEQYDLQQVDNFITSNSDLDWLWSVHCETSTGVLNELTGLEALCLKHHLKLCLDCTSSLGTVPVDLRGVYLASSVSGKGLAAFPGVSLVFYNHPVSADSSLPRYLDLGYYHEKEGIPFTHSSNLIGALRQALVDLQAESRFKAIRELNLELSQRLADSGFVLLGSALHTSPAVISIVLPERVSSRRLGKAMEKRGWLLSYLSGYLLERNIVQICIMGTVAEDICLQMVDALKEVAVGLSTDGSPSRGGNENNKTARGMRVRN